MKTPFKTLGTVVLIIALAACADKAKRPTPYDNKPRILTSEEAFELNNPTTSVTSEIWDTGLPKWEKSQIFTCDGQAGCSPDGQRATRSARCPTIDCYALIWLRDWSDPYKSDPKNAHRWALMKSMHPAIKFPIPQELQVVPHKPQTTH